MNDKAKIVFAGYCNLSYEDRKEFRLALRGFEDKNFEEKQKVKKQISESVSKISLGPISEVCPCCGR